MRVRFSISVMMAVVALAGIILAASSHVGRPQPNYAAILAPSVLVLGLLRAAILGASLKTDEKRGFWLGFAVFGWAFWLMGLMTHGFPVGFFALLGSVPFGYIGGVIGRAFAAEHHAKPLE